jgi:hypothetical protein
VSENSGGFDGNTYAKGLGEKSSVMDQAYARGDKNNGDRIKNNLKNQFADWFNYQTSEGNGRYFSIYPEVYLRFFLFVIFILLF